MLIYDKGRFLNPNDLNVFGVTVRRHINWDNQALTGYVARAINVIKKVEISQCLAGSTAE